jgi:hypothetical protein
MSLPKKGSRTLEVGERTYRWYVRKKPTDAQGMAQGSMTVGIELESDGPTRVLVADLRVTRPDNGIRPHQTALKPYVIRAIVAQALGEGWQPVGSGPPHQTIYQLIRDKP